MPGRMEGQAPTSDSEHTSHFLGDARGFIIQGGQFFNASGDIVTVIRPSTQSQIVSEAGPSDVRAIRQAAIHSQSTQDEEESEIYARLLCPKRRGFPLWCPNPNVELPSAYREDGIRIGDVGIININGEFDFLFNILLPPEHPVNQNRVPVGFQPLTEPLDFNSGAEHDPGEYVLSGSIEGQRSSRTLPNGCSNEFYFECNIAKGAILILPEGSTRKDLLSENAFRDCASRNGEAWYQYARGPRARDAVNGSLHLVTGHDKGTSWAVSAFAQASESRCSLQFTANFASGRNGANYHYFWNKIGPGRLKHGPRPVARNMNQCFFVRTFTITLNNRLWARLFGPGLASVTVNNPQDYEGLLSRPRAIARDTQLSTFFSSLLTTSGSASHSHLLSNVSPSDKEHVTPDVTVTPNFRNLSSINHPAKIINQYLLDKAPIAKMAITHDDDWCSVLSEGEDELPDHSEFIRRIEFNYHVMREDDCVFLSRKDKDNSATLVNSGSSQQLGLATPSNSPNNPTSAYRFNDRGSPVMNAGVSRIMNVGLYFEGLQNITRQVEVLDTVPFAFGGIGDIKRGFWNKLGNDGRANVCIKFLRGEIVAPQESLRHEQEQHQRRESRIWGSLNHPNILPLLGLFLDERFHLCGGLVSPYREAGDVTTYLSQNVKVDKKSILAGIANGLDYLHSNNIAHGDMNPKNIVIKIENGQIIPELMDFGLSRMLLQKGDTVKVMGRVRYMAPEFLLDEKADANFPSKPGDVYSFGMTMLEIITGHVPFYEIKSEHKVINMVERGERPDYHRYSASNLLVAYLPLIKACWENDPDRRCSMGRAVSFLQSL